MWTTSPIIGLALSPAWILTGALLVALVYFLLAVALDLPLPGATRGGEESRLPAPRYTGRKPARRRKYRR